MNSAFHRAATHVRLALMVVVAGCSRSESPPPTPAERAAHKAAIAAAAQDRMRLQYLVKDAEVVKLRLRSLRRETRGYMLTDTSVIWFAYFAGDSLIVLDETRRVPKGVEENARYFFRDSLLQYVTFDRVLAAGTRTPQRTRLAFGYDSAGTLVATSKNVNDAAVPLDSVADIFAIASRARTLRSRVIAP